MRQGAPSAPYLRSERAESVPPKSNGHPGTVWAVCPSNRRWAEISGYGMERANLGPLPLSIPLSGPSRHGPGPHTHVAVETE
ncbi:hypothetical protein CEXT_36051 [Caerostris extrusa]|uniref:Uncharacterized protein n=1 Tax=Caerostris extrusa TaxID=172846 RepID=A0AAV4MIL7_CAEEX|nr:hypothetical protein CEXT_36051 [Caerostris extrusa]